MIGQQDGAIGQGFQYVLGAPSVMGLAFGELQHDRQARGIDKGVNFGCQATA